MSGYRLAMKESIKFIKDQLVVRGSAPNHPVFQLFLSWRRPQPANAGCGHCNAPSSQPSRLSSLPAGIRPTRPCQRHRGTSLAPRAGCTQSLGWAAPSALTGSVCVPSALRGRRSRALILASCCGLRSRRRPSPQRSLAESRTSSQTWPSMPWPWSRRCARSVPAAVHRAASPPRRASLSERWPVRGLSIWTVPSPDVPAGQPGERQGLLPDQVCRHPEAARRFRKRLDSHQRLHPRGRPGGAGHAADGQGRQDRAA
eukprot:scaffold6621_cov112-Isochrysis_galbana.AAC.5